MYNYSSLIKGAVIVDRYFGRMMKKAAAITIAAVMALTIVPVMHAENVHAAEHDVESMLAGMTTREKIEQCIMIDFRKWKDDSGNIYDMTVLDDEVAELLANYKFGALILFGENIKETDETVDLIKAMQQAEMSKGGLPMMIATDQEGGIVYRLGSGTALPGNMAVTAAGVPAYAESVGNIIGSELEAVGINTTLAPVLDVNNNPSNPVIGIRSFSDDPEIVSTYGSCFVAGLQKHNVIGCAKHFPGHGDTATDSHYGLPIVDKSLEELEQCELKPFRIVNSMGIDMVMTAHILYPQIDDTQILSEKTGNLESRPATMSSKILQGILRDSIGFNGVVVTDGMNMKGIADHFTMEQATLESLKAGADMICMPVSDVYDRDEWIAKMDSILDTAEQAAEKDQEFAARLDQAVRRILLMKDKRGILDYDPDDYTKEHAAAVVGCEENRRIEREISAKGVTVVRNENGTLPLKVTKDTHVLMLAPYDNEKASMVIGFNRAKQAGIVPASANVWIQRFSQTDYKIDDKIDTELEAALDWADIVFINSEIYYASRMAYDHWTSEGPKMYTDYCRKNGKKSVVMSIVAPYDVQLYPNADAVLALYGWKGSGIRNMPGVIYGGVTSDANAVGPNIVAGVEVSFGVYGASGTLPVNIPEYDMETRAFTDKILYERGFGLKYDKVDPPLLKPVIKTLKAGKKKLTVTMTTSPSMKNGTKYQVAYRIKGASKWSYKTAASAKLTISKLKKGKKYQVKVRTTKAGVKASAWSSIRTGKKIK